MVFFPISIELCARLDDKIAYAAPFWSKYDASLLRTNDSDGIRCNVPGARFEKWMNNSLGFRGPELNEAKAAGTRRVACMGTSETYGLYESPGKEWPAQLRSVLAQDRRFEVVNASTVGLSFRDYRRYIERHVLKLQPDLVILLINPQMYVTNFYEDIAKPAAQAGGAADEQVRSPRHKNSVNIVSGFQLRCMAKLKQSIKRFLPERLTLEFQIWQETKNLSASEQRVFAAGKIPIDSIPEPYVEGYHKDVSLLVAYLKEKGIKVILCSYPWLMSEKNLKCHPAIFLSARTYSPMLSYRGMIDASVRLADATRQIAEEQGIGFVDCYRLVPQDLTCFADNVHYTDHGAKLVSRNVEDFVLSHYQQVYQAR